ncbi:hypothetical protein MTO96_040855 [Rhipicephalus appendiculatus]
MKTIVAINRVIKGGTGVFAGLLKTIGTQPAANDAANGGNNGNVSDTGGGKAANRNVDNVNKDTHEINTETSSGTDRASVTTSKYNTSGSSVGSANRDKNDGNSSEAANDFKNNKGGHRKTVDTASEKRTAAREKGNDKVSDGSE